MTRSWIQQMVAPVTLVAVLSATPAFAGPLPDTEKLRDRAESALQAVDATPQQREKTWSILDSALEHMRSFRAEGQALRERLWDAFVSGDKVDRGQIHSIRLQFVDLFDRATGKGFDVMSDIADVFTPQQRQKLRQIRQTHLSRQQDGGWDDHADGGGKSGGKAEGGRQRERRSDTVAR
jgi:Spy/CpxP family protein refolding chaperone